MQNMTKKNADSLKEEIFQNIKEYFETISIDDIKPSKWKTRHEKIRGIKLLYFLTNVRFLSIGS